MRFQIYRQSDGDVDQSDPPCPFDDPDKTRCTWNDAERRWEIEIADLPALAALAAREDVPLLFVPTGRPGEPDVLEIRDEHFCPPEGS